MPFDAHANLAYSTLVSAPTPALSGTALSVASGQGALFPAVPFNATVWPPSVMPITTNAEIVRVTNITGDVLTIARAQESTTAMPLAVGYQIANTITKKVITDIESAVSGGWITALTGDVTASGVGSVAATVVNLTSGVTMPGTILASAIADPATPFTNKGYIYMDSTHHILNIKNDAGVVSNTVIPSAAVSNQFLTALAADGTLSRAQPAFTNISGTVSNGQLANSTITIAGTSTALGGSIAQDTITGLSSTGLIKRTGANVLAIAVAGTDYQSAITFGTGVQTALGVNVGTAGSIVVNGGALGTPSGGTVTNLSGTASININGTVGATTPSTGAFTTLSATGAISITSSGQYFTQNAAIINRLNDRLFLGGATASDGYFPQVANDWFSTFQNANGYTGATLLGDLVVETGTNAADSVAGLFAARSLNNTSANVSTIGVMAFAINNNATLATNAWAFYGEAHRLVTTTGSVYGMELDTRTLFASSIPTPYTQGNVVALQLASGAGVTAVGQFDASAAIQIEANPMKFAAGIVFGKDSLTGDDGTTGTATAIALAKGHILTWFNPSGTAQAKVYSTGSTGNLGSSLAFSDSGATITDYSGNAIFQVGSSATAIADFFYLTGGVSASNAVTVAAAGTDTNIDIRLTPKGTGRITSASGITSTGATQIFGAGGTGTNQSVAFLNGGSGAAGGSLVAFQVNTVDKGYVGLSPVIFGGSTQDLIVYSNSNTVKVYGAGTLSGVFSATGLAVTGALSATGTITSTLATGTAPLTVASTTQVANLNVSQLVGATWIAPGTIGSTTPNTGAFTTLSATGLQITGSGGLQLLDQNASGDILSITYAETAGGGGGGETLTLDMRGGYRTLTIGGNLTLTGNNTVTAWTTTGTLTTNGAATFKSSLTANLGAVSLRETTIAGAAATTALTITQTARTSGSAPYIKWSIPNDTGLMASTEAQGLLTVSGTRTWATTGTVATQREILFAAPTYASASASQTFTKAATVAISGAPIAGTNAIITNSYALWVQAGLAQFDGTVSVASGTVSLPGFYLNTDTTTGLYRIGANNIGVAVSAAKVLDISSTGLAVTGTLSATGNMTGGIGSTGTNQSLLTLNGGSGAGGSSMLVLRANSVDKAYVGLAPVILGGTTQDLLLYSPSDTVKIYGAGTLVGVFSSTGLAVTGALSATGAVKFSNYGAGAATFDASGNITSVSDERMKRNIRPFARGLSDILALKPILHGYTVASGLDQTRDDYAGFSAQQVQQFIPEAIGQNKDGMLSFSDRPILAALVNAIAELNAKLEELLSK